MVTMKYLISVAFIIASIFGGFAYFGQSNGVGGGLGTIEQLGLWFFDGTNITQNTSGTPVKLTGYESSGDCLVTNASGVLATSSCGGGGSSKWTDGGTVIYPTTGESIAVSSIAATGTATSTFTNLAVSGALNLFGTIGASLSSFCVAITGGSGLCDGSDDGGGSATTTPGGSDTQIQFNDGGVFGGDSGLTFNKTNNTLDVTGATITASDPVIDMTQVWNSAGVTFTGLKLNATSTASAAASLLMDIQESSATKFAVGKTGITQALRYTNLGAASAGGLEFTSGYTRLLGYDGKASISVGLTSGLPLMLYGVGFGANYFTPDAAFTRLSAGTIALGNGIASNATGTLILGNLGIGDSSPASPLTVGNGDLFQVNSSGAIAAATGIISSGAIQFSGLTSCDTIDTDANGILSCGTDATGGGGGGGGLSTTTPWTNGNLAYVTGLGSVGSVATGTLTETATGLEFNATRGLVGGAAVLSLTSGYVIPLSASTTEWSGFYNTPSTRITANDGLTWSGNNLNFDGGNAPGGELGGTWASPTIDDSLAVTSWNLTTPTLTSFFGTPCTGNFFLQDISDTGAFTCVEATGGGGSGDTAWATTTLLDGATAQYPISPTVDILFGGNSTSTAGFWFDKSATTTRLGNGGAGDSIIELAINSITRWVFGADDSDSDAFVLSSGSALGTTNKLRVTTSTTTVNNTIIELGNGTNGLKITPGTSTTTLEFY